MGTGARDDINIGVGIEAIPGSEAVADRVNAKLGDVRRQAQALAREAGVAADAQGKIAITLEEGRAAWAAAEGDMSRFRAELAKIVAARQALANAPPIPPITQQAPAQSGQQSALSAERAALQAHYLLELDLTREAVEKRQVSELAGRQLSLAAEQRYLDGLLALDEAHATETVNVVKQEVDSQLKERQRLGSANARIGAAPLAVPIGAQPAVAAVASPLIQNEQALATEVNVAIGAFERQARTIDLMNQKAVTAFRAEGDALSVYLAKLGATDTELNTIANIITRLERRAGAATVPLVPSVRQETILSYDRLGGRLRTAANATALLGQAAVTGSGSLAGLASAAGNVAFGIGAFATGSLSITVAAIGAVVTGIVAVVELFSRWREETQKETVALNELNQKMLEGGKSTAIQAILNRTEADLAAARAERAQLEAEKRRPAPASAFGPGGAPPVNTQQLAIEQANQNVARLEAQQTALSLALVKHAQDAAKQVEAEQQKAADDAVRIQTERTRGEFAARRVAIDQEFAQRKKDLLASGADQSKINAALTELENKRAEAIVTNEHDKNLKLSTLRRQAAGELLVVQTEQLQGEVAAQKAAIAVELQSKLAGIAAEVGLEAVRGVRIAAARAEATEKIRKIDVEQERKRADLQRQIDADIADAQTGGRSELDRAIEAANRKREERQREIDKVSVGDAEATFNERNQLELEANDARDKEIAAARKTHSEELKKIADDTENAILELTGRASDARRNIINQEIDERIKKARQLKAPESTIQGLEQERGLRLSGVDFDDLRAKGTKALDELDSDLQRTQALAVSGAISERQARDQVIDAYDRAHEAISALLPDLVGIEIAAKASGDAATVHAIEQLKNKYLELGNTLSQLRDTFARLKQTARESTTDALAGIFEGATKLGSQDTSQIAALSDQLRSARQELNDLLSTPSGTRTAEQNQRITALRGEIEQTTVSLDQAKSSITTWRDLFINAAQAVVDALIRVSSQMLATQLITSALGFFGGLGGGGGGSSLGPRPEGGGATGGFGFGFAEGGPVGGRSGRDANWARVTAGEFMQPIPAVQTYGADFMEAQRRLAIPRWAVRALMNDATMGMRSMNLRPRMGSTRFADGGLVSASEVGARGSAGEVHHVRIVAPAGFQLEHLNTPAGGRVIVELIADRANAVNAALGRR